MRDGAVPPTQGDEMTPARFLENALINLSHELRTPLAAAKGYTTSLLRHDQRLTRDERLMMLGEIDHACDRLDDIIEQTLMTARLLQNQVSLQRHETDLITLTQSAIAGREQAEQGTCVITFAAGAESLPILADDGYLLRAIDHLLSNACVYSPEGGPIIITARRIDREGKPLAEWSVEDHGIGIAPEHLPHVFTPFYRVESDMARATNGLGLGLAFAQRVIALLGGELCATSIPGKGSRFWFTLPLL